MQSQPTLDTILAHRSIRRFTEQPISLEIVEMLRQAASRASTSNNLQCVSIIRVTDPALRKGIREASGMEYVETCAEFWLFCIDFHKHQQVGDVAEALQREWAEVSLIGALDTGIMAQNVLLAAESLGLGGVFIGALRNHIQQVSDLVKLPQHCVPMVGLCLGYPDQDPPFKPRLPINLLVMENQYQEMDSSEFAKYNEKVTAYYQVRSGKAVGWEYSIQKALCEPVRPHILPYFQQQGLLKK